MGIMQSVGMSFNIVPYKKENGFHPLNSAYFDRGGLTAKTHIFAVISNPQHPPGQARYGQELKQIIELAEQHRNGCLLDEAYEMFHAPQGSGRMWDIQQCLPEIVFAIVPKVWDSFMV